MPPEAAASFEKTLALGKEIAKDLEDHDVLGRWMAHHISDLITRVENSPIAEADGIRRETATAILALWSHRRTLPMDGAPMAAFDPVLRGLERLGEPHDPWSFYRAFPRGREPSASDMASVQLLRIALTLENNVRDVVLQTVAYAAHEASDREAPWLDRSEHLPEDDERKAIEAVRELARAISTETEEVGDGPGGERALDIHTSGLIAALARTESSVREVRQALEKTQTQTGGAESVDG